MQLQNVSDHVLCSHKSGHADTGLVDLSRFTSEPNHSKNN